MQPLTRCDEKGVPRLVQRWSYDGYYVIRAYLCDGSAWSYSKDGLEQWALPKYTRWNEVTHDLALEGYVAAHWLSLVRGCMQFSTSGKIAEKSNCSCQYPEPLGVCY